MGAGAVVVARFKKALAAPRFFLCIPSATYVPRRMLATVLCLSAVLLAATTREVLAFAHESKVRFAPLKLYPQSDCKGTPVTVTCPVEQCETHNLTAPVLSWEVDKYIPCMVRQRWTLARPRQALTH